MLLEPRSLLCLFSSSGQTPRAGARRTHGHGMRVDTGCVWTHSRSSACDYSTFCSRNIYVFEVTGQRCPYDAGSVLPAYPVTSPGPQAHGTARWGQGPWPRDPERGGRPKLRVAQAPRRGQKIQQEDRTSQAPGALGSPSGGEAPVPHGTGDARQRRPPLPALLCALAHLQVGEVPGAVVLLAALPGERGPEVHLDQLPVGAEADVAEDAGKGRGRKGNHLSLPASGREPLPLGASVPLLTGPATALGTRALDPRTGPSWLQACGPGRGVPTTIARCLQLTDGTGGVTPHGPPQWTRKWVQSCQEPGPPRCHCPCFCPAK